jgi:hypothetical protein
MKLPSKAEVDKIRKQFPVGSRVELICMDDPYTNMKPGERGFVTGVDDVASIEVTWDCGSTLAIVFDEDECRLIWTRSWPNPPARRCWASPKRGRGSQNRQSF